MPGTRSINRGGRATTNEALSALSGGVQGPAAWDQAGIDAAKADPARAVAFRPGERAPQSTGPHFNLRPRKATELAQVQGQAANTVAETQGKSAVEVAKQNTVTAVEQAKATEADKTRRANEALQGKQVEAQGRVDAAKASKADVAPGAAKNYDAALKSIDEEINGTTNGKTVIPGLAQRAEAAAAEKFRTADTKRRTADLADQLAKAKARRQALIDGMTGAPAAQAPEAQSPEQKKAAIRQANQGKSDAELAPLFKKYGLAEPSPDHIEILRDNPNLEKYFDAKFGAGAAAKYLGNPAAGNK